MKPVRRTVEEIYAHDPVALSAIREARRRADSAARRFLELGLADRTTYDLTPYGQGPVTGILDLRCTGCGAVVGELCRPHGRPTVGGCAPRVQAARAFFGKPCREAREQMGPEPRAQAQDARQLGLFGEGDGRPRR